MVTSLPTSNTPPISNTGIFAALNIAARPRSEYNAAIADIDNADNKVINASVI